MIARKNLALLACLLANLTTLAGCQSLTEMEPQWPWQRNQEPEAVAAPTQMIVVWTDAVYTTPGKPPTRGFGGRIYFYNDRHITVPVDGELIVYAYDDHEIDSPQVADRKYVFKSEHLKSYYGESELGSSYNIWIPWDAYGGQQREISLVPIFTDAGTGRIVKANPSLNILPGRRELNEKEKRGFFVNNRADAIKQSAQGRPNGSVNDVQQVNFESTSTERSIPTTTIHLPRSMTQRLQGQYLQRQIEAQQEKTATDSNGGSPTTFRSTRTNPSPLTPQGNTQANASAARAAWVDQEAQRKLRQMQDMMAAMPNNARWGNPAPNEQAPGNQPRARQIGPQSHDTPLGQTGFVGANPNHSISATARPWARQDARSAHFERPRFPAPTLPGSRPGFERSPIQRSQ